MSDPDPGSGPPPDESPDETEEAPAQQPGDAHAHLRIIAPDPVPEGTESAPKAASTHPPVPKGREPGAPRVRVFSDSDDPALMPLPAMGPGSGGSRIESEGDDAAPGADAATADDAEGAAAVGETGETGETGDVEGSSDPGEAGATTAASGGHDAAGGDAGGKDQAAHAEEPTTVESEPAPASEDGAGDGDGAEAEAEAEDSPPARLDDDATDTQTMEAATPPAATGAEEADEREAAAGVPGVRLDRSDTGEIIKVSPDSLTRGGDGAAVVVDAAAPGEGSQEATPAMPGSAAAAPATFSHRPSPLVKVATGIGFGLVAVAVILLGKPAFAALAGILIVWGVVEFYLALYNSVSDDEQPAVDLPESGGVVTEAHVPPVRALALRSAAVVGVAAVAAMAVTSYFFGLEATAAVAAGALIAVGLWFVPQAGGSVPPHDAALSLLAIVHVGVAGSFALLILRLEHGFALLLVVVILTVVSDVAAYGWGASVGRTPFFASVSPNKTLEGFVGAVATTIVAGFVIAGLHGWLYPSVPVVASWGQVLLLATLVAVFATAGDLAESLFKRDLGIKDVASILPGHGGMMDRLDGMIFALPVAYLFLRAMGLADVG